MKTKKIKRVLAFFLAVVFAFSTCMTASPYTVQATEEPKLSVNVTNAATTETGPGLTKGIDLVINYGENQKKLRIENDQLGNELSTDILYEEFSDASYSVSLQCYSRNIRGCRDKKSEYNDYRTQSEDRGK